MKPRFLLLATTLLLTAAIPSARAELNLTFGGDMNFNSSRQDPLENAASKNGRLFPYQSLFTGIAPFLDGQLNFANIETVISERKDLPDTGGKFVFASHPNGIHAAASNGLNLFALANNHAGDHGLPGMLETISNMGELSRTLGFHAHGLARTRKEVLKPTVFDVPTPSGVYRIAFLSITGVANAPSQASADRAGALYLRDANDFADGMAQMAAVKADYKILSIHWGRETVVTLDSGQRNLYRRALAEGDIDLILGHHPHVVRPVEKVGHKVIFYSLGNYLMLGAANINGKGPMQNFGLLGKLHLEWDPGKQRLVAQAAEAIPLYDMHYSPKPLDAKNAANRIGNLNQLGTQQLGENVLSFGIDSRGYGISCLGSNPGPRAQKICAALRR